MQRPFAHLAGLGVYLPAQVVTNQDFAARLETSDQWIVERTGIRERRYASAAEPVSRPYLGGHSRNREAWLLLI